jgi:hypothetical protein
MWQFVSQSRKYSIEPHDVLICLSVEEVLNRTVLPQLRDKLSHHEALLSISSTERQIITWGSIEYFLNWETNYHMRFYYKLCYSFNCLNLFPVFFYILNSIIFIDAQLYSKGVEGMQHNIIQYKYTIEVKEKDNSKQTSIIHHRHYWEKNTS